MQCIDQNIPSQSSRMKCVSVCTEILPSACTCLFSCVSRHQPLYNVATRCQTISTHLRGCYNDGGHSDKKKKVRSKMRKNLGLFWPTGEHRNPCWSRANFECCVDKPQPRNPAHYAFKFCSLLGVASAPTYDGPLVSVYHFFDVVGTIIVHSRVVYVLEELVCLKQKYLKNLLSGELINTSINQTFLQIRPVT